MANPWERALKVNLVFGMVGALMLAVGDWTMVFGDPAHIPGYFWLSEGAKHIPAWRNTLAIALGIPAVILCAMAMLALEQLVKPGELRKYWRYLTTFSLLPWLTVHSFIVMQLFTYGWMSTNGYEEAAAPVVMAVTQHYAWMSLACFIMISVPFFMWLIFGLRGKLKLPRLMGLVTPVIFVPLLVALRPLVPESPFKPGYINAEISTSFFLFFAGILIYLLLKPPSQSTATKRKES